MGELWTEIRTDRISPADRFEFYRHVVGELPVPLAVEPLAPGGGTTDFRARMATTRFDAVTLVALSSWTGVPYEACRTPAMIRRADPESFRILLNLSGRTDLTQAERDISLGAGELALFDTSMPFVSRRGLTTRDTPERLLMVTFPRARLPLPSDAVRPLLCRAISGRTGIAALLRALLVRLNRDAGRYDQDQMPGLAAIVLDLVTMLLAEQLGTHTSPPTAQRHARLLRVQEFIAARLGDPDLTPASIAAAQYLSARSLHRLFHEHGLTVCGWIRRERLERCRRDLANPRLRTLPVHTVGRQWGFVDSTCFSRTFRTAYAISPDAYRRAALGDR